MTISQILNHAIKQLKKAKISSAVLDAEALLGLAVKKPKEWILTHPEYNLKTQEYKNIKKYIARRKKREPVAYITGNKEFFGLDFFVDKNVLIPRPETELMVEKVLEILGHEIGRPSNFVTKKKINLIDIGAGSGCVPISVLKWIPAYEGMTKRDAGMTKAVVEMTTMAIDYSANTLKVAKKNAAKHKVKIKFLKGNLLSPFKKLPSGEIIITANLPYLSESQYKKLPPEIKKYEPKNALVAGKDGLKYYRDLLMDFRRRTLGHQVSRLGLCRTRRSDGMILGGKTRKNGNMWLMLEIDPSQSKKIKKITTKILPKAKIEILKDLAMRDRLVIIKINR